MKIVDLFVEVVNMSITASLAAGCLLLVRVLFRKYMTAGFRYLMWLLVFLRLCIPVSIKSPFSLLQLFSESTSTASDQYIVSIEYIENMGGYLPLEGDHWNRYIICAVIWFSVFLLLLIGQMIVYLLTNLWLKKAQLVALDDLVDECQQKLGTKKKIAIYRSSLFDTPVIIGIFFSRIILPDFIGLYNKRELCHILLHEMVHMRRNDQLTKIIVTVLLYFHWFNPVVWLCYRQFIKDIELSCDEMVLSVLDEREKFDYAETLVNYCSKQKYFFSGAGLSFSEQRSVLSQRVHSVLDYRPLGKLRKFALASLMVGMALLINTNPLPDYTGYRPEKHVIDPQRYEAYETLTKELIAALSEGDGEKVLLCSQYADPFYRDTLHHLEETPILIDRYQLYPQTEELIYAYLLSEDGNKFVAQLEWVDEKVQLTQLQSEPIFSSSMMTGNDEGKRFIQHLYSFGIIGVEEQLPDSTVARFCIAEEYYDRVKSGELEEGATQLPIQWIQEAAWRYFAYEDFSYTEDELLYDAEQECYLYTSNDTAPCNAQVISCEEEGDRVIVKSYLYQDPLKLIPEATITYYLTKNR